MTTRRRLREAKRRRSRRIRALLAAGAVFGVGAAGTLAAWNDSEYATTTVQAGTFAVEVRADAGSFTDTSPTNKLTLNFGSEGAYFPGSTRTRMVQVRTKSSSLAGFVGISSIAVTGSDGSSAPADNSANLAAALEVTYAVATSPAGSPSCASPLQTVTVTGAATVPAIDPVPLLAGSGNHVTFCITIALPASAGNNTQGGDVRPTWTIEATTG